jgi:hypothetical protein
VAKKIYVIEEKKDRSGWWVILVAGLLIAYWKVALAVALAIVGVYLILQFIKGEQARRDYKRVNDAMLSMEADHQNMMYLQEGDIYGRYQPVTMPITSARSWYDYP